MRCTGTGRACRAVGFALLCSALGCGGKVADDAQLPAPTSSPPYVNVPPTSPAPAQGRNQPAPLPTTTPQPATPPRSEPVIDDWVNAENVLAANCGQCHGPALLPEQAQAGVNFINDIDALVRAGWIVPLSSATSLVVIAMRNGSMPPPESGLLPVTEADIELVERYIDDPRTWSRPAAPASFDAGVDVPAPSDAGADGG